MHLRLIARQGGIRLLLALMLAGLPWAAYAHGDWPPKHGGVMNDGETSFELVERGDGVLVYVEDHGEPVRTASSKPTLVVLHDGAREVKGESYDGAPRGENQLFFPKVRLRTTDEVQLRVTFANGSIAIGKFPAKLRARRPAERSGNLRSKP